MQISFIPPVMAIIYVLSAIAIVAAGACAYIWATPYREMKLIRDGSLAAALSMGGAIFGITLPVGSAIFFTHGMLEMMLWGAFGSAVQIFFHLLMKRRFSGIEQGNVAEGMLSMFTSISIGLIVALSIS